MDNKDTKKDAISNETVGEANSETPPIPKFTVAVLAVLCALSLGTGLYYWYTTYYLPAEPVAQAMAQTPTPTPVAPAAQSTESAPSDDAHGMADEATGSFHPTDEDPTDDMPPPPRPMLDPRPQFVDLWAQYGNQDIVGHLFIDGTALDVYVVQGRDNAFYTQHDIYGSPSDTGWVFLDADVDILLDWDMNVVIYGYDGSAMQQVLREYFEYDFFLANPVVTFNTQYAEYDWEIFAFYVAPPDFPFAVVGHPFETWGDMVDRFTMAAIYNTRLDVMEFDQVLTLVAPVMDSEGIYYVLQARLLRHVTS